MRSLCDRCRLPVWSTHCAVCGTEIQTRTEASTCSDTCRVALHRRRKLRREVPEGREAESGLWEEEEEDWGVEDAREDWGPFTSG